MLRFVESTNLPGHVEETLRPTLTTLSGTPAGLSDIIGDSNLASATGNMRAAWHVPNWLNRLVLACAALCHPQRWRDVYTSFFC